MIEQEITGLIAWRAAELPPEPGTVRLDEAALAEITALGGELAANPLPLEALCPADFDLPACRAVTTANAGNVWWWQEKQLRCCG